MKFSIIYSVDIPKRENSHGLLVPVARLSEVAPPKFKRGTWVKTEDSKSMGNDDPENFNHAKWVAILDKKQFTEFVCACSLRADSVETMGSLGAPGFGIGWAPAISFNTEAEPWYGNAYVTPLPTKRNGEPIRKDGAKERDWERIKKRIVEVF